MSTADNNITYPFSNQIVFALVMRDENMCRQFLERVFPGKKVSQIRLVEENPMKEEGAQSRAEVEKVLLSDMVHKSVRLDVLFEDEEAWHDIELQVELKGHLPKRTRYYHSMITTHILKSGKDYEELRPCYVIFICLFDLFDKGEAVYRFQYYDDKNSLPLGDESYTIILNSKAKREKIPKELRDLFDYLNKGKLRAGGDTFVEEIHRQVVELNHRRELTGMITIGEQMELEKKWAREEGREEGLKEGSQEKALEVARRMKVQGIAIEVIAECTGLTEKEVKQI